MPKNTTTPRRRLTAGVTGIAALVLAGSMAGVARAAEPAGTGVQITAAHTFGSTLTWSGSYSCAGGVADTVMVRASDELGHSATGLAVITCLGSTTGAPIGGSLATGLLGLGGSWGSDVTITVTMRGLLGNPLASARAALVQGHLDEVSLDVVTTTGGGLQLSGGYRCDSPTGTATIHLTATDQATGTPLGDTTQTLSCAGHVDSPGAWTTTVAPPSGSDVHIEVDFTANEDSKTAMLDVTAS